MTNKLRLKHLKLMHIANWLKLKDNCSVCYGERGGVRGNENIINGKIMCDYCDYDLNKDIYMKLNHG